VSKSIEPADQNQTRRNEVLEKASGADHRTPRMPNYRHLR